MREAYVPLTYNEESSNWRQIMRRSNIESEAEKKLFSIDALNKHILEVYNRLMTARSVMSDEKYKNKNIKFSLGGYRICEYSHQNYVDENTEGLLLKWFDYARTRNQEIKRYFKSVIEQLEDKIGAEILMMNQPTSIIDIADKYGLSIEETVTKMKQVKYTACKIAYWDYVEESEKSTRDIFNDLENAGLTKGQTIEEFYALLRKE